MRKQSTQHSEVNHEDKLKVEDKSNATIFNNNAMSETLQTKKFWWWRYPPYRKY